MSPSPCRIVTRALSPPMSRYFSIRSSTSSRALQGVSVGFPVHAGEHGILGATGAMDRNPPVWRYVCLRRAPRELRRADRHGDQQRRPG